MMARLYRIGMTDAERAAHTPGRGAKPGSHLNLTVTLADRWHVIGSRVPTSPGYRKPTFAGFDPTERQFKKWRHRAAPQ